LIAFLLAIGDGGGPTPALVSAGLALVAGICSVARLNPALRRPQAGEERELQPAPQLR
jgi:DHA2 family multidrug resistance protein-like MFS transporter